MKYLDALQDNGNLRQQLKACHGKHVSHAISAIDVPHPYMCEIE